MPEPNWRRALVGTRQAEKDFEAYVRERLIAEGGADKLEAEVKALALVAREMERQGSEARR